MNGLTGLLKPFFRRSRHTILRFPLHTIKQWPLLSDGFGKRPWRIELRSLRASQNRKNQQNDPDFGTCTTSPVKSPEALIGIILELIPWTLAAYASDGA